MRGWSFCLLFVAAFVLLLWPDLSSRDRADAVILPILYKQFRRLFKAKQEIAIKKGKEYESDSGMENQNMSAQNKCVKNGSLKVGTPGIFDYWHLDFSSAPLYCQQFSAQEQKEKRECAKTNDEYQYGFVLHGLWPQYLTKNIDPFNGCAWPQNCPTYNETYSEVELEDFLRKASLHSIPFKGEDGWRLIAPEYDTLILHEWRKHGTCSGLHPLEYFQYALQFGYEILEKTSISNTLWRSPFKAKKEVKEKQDNEKVAQELPDPRTIKSFAICYSKDFNERLNSCTL